MRWLLVILLSVGAGPAWATPPTSSGEADKQIERATRLLEAQRYEEALVELQALEAIAEDLPNRGILYGNIGYCLVQLGRKQEALAAFEQGLRLAELAEIRAGLQYQIDKLKSDGVDGPSQCTDARDARPGDGCSADIAAPEQVGKPTDQEGNSEPRQEESEPVPQMAQLTVRCGDSVEALVRIGTGADKTCPAEFTGIPPGVHIISMRGTDGSSINRSVELEAGQALEVDVGAPQEDHVGLASAATGGPPDNPPVRAEEAHDDPQQLGPIIVAVSGGVALVAGGLSLAYAMDGTTYVDQAQADYDSATTEEAAEKFGSRLKSEVDRTQRARIAGYALVGVGASLVLTGVVWQLGRATAGEQEVRVGAAPDGVRIWGTW